MKLDAVQTRVLGSLLEKQRTTPDAYPLTLNGLKSACNQLTARDPVAAYEVPQIRAALDELHRRGYARTASGPGSRVAKYRHLLADALGLERPQQAVLAVLLLRGPQTVAEVTARTDRLCRFAPGEIDVTIDDLVARGLAERLARRPGQKEPRVRQTMSEAEGDESPLVPRAPAAAAAEGHVDEAAPPSAPPPTLAAPAAPASPPPAPVDDGLRDRVAALEAELAAQRETVDAVRAELAALRADLGA